MRGHPVVGPAPDLVLPAAAERAPALRARRRVRVRPRRDHEVLRGLDLVAVSKVLLPLGFYSFGRKAIGSADSSDLLVGNAALCISELARSEAVMRDLDQRGAIDLVEPLTRVAHKRTGTAQRNAAIALARMAKTPQYVDKLREHHAFEIIAKYVKI